MKTLDQKLAALRKNPGANEFILADAKDADMAFGIAAPGAPYRLLSWALIVRPRAYNGAVEACFFGSISREPRHLSMAGGKRHGLACINRSARQQVFVNPEQGGSCPILPDFPEF